MSTEIPAYPFPARDGVAPDPQYARARATGCPVQVDVGNGRSAWLMTTMADVRQVHHDRRFSRAAAAAASDVLSSGLAPPAGSLLSLDPPDHTRVRSLVAGAFSARRITALAPKVAERARSLLDGLPADQPVDLVAAFARPLSAGVIGELLGVPAEDHARFSRWADAFLSTEDESETGRARGALAGYVVELLGSKAVDPDDDLLSYLAQQETASRQELVLLAVGVLVAGHETTANQLASSLLFILDDPAVADRLRGSPDAVRAVVEELLRLVSLGSVGGFPRMAVEDVEVAGITILAGDLVIAALNAANRDPAVFPDPDSFEPGRFAGMPPTHVAFGSGAHHCLGAALARLELAEAITAVLETRPEARLCPSAGQHWQRGSMVRGLVDLPVLLGPRSDRSRLPAKENTCTAP